MPPVSRVERAIRQLEKIHQADSARAILHLRTIVDEKKSLPTYNEARWVREIEKLQHRALLTVQDIEIFAQRLLKEEVP